MGFFIKIIFLDIDGVLNCNESKSRCGGFIGIDDSKVKCLAEIVKETDAKIVLCSSWKSDWERINKSEQGQPGNYLDKKLRKEKLYVLDKTSDNGENRGEGIHNWIQAHSNIESWVVLDDEVFSDYEKFNIMPHLIKTNFYAIQGGLLYKHVDHAIKILNNALNEISIR